ncbi:MAG: hypothetical protein EBR82_72535, partial [Caulobacteraceae bacterium]|nr:hypothetical protein [Caulobacteraceae bacterium]
APHGFLRDASHNEGRYVCECEFWEPQEHMSADSEIPTLDETSTLEMWLNATKRIEAAIDFYEAALKAAYPTGATGEAFYWWNEARKAVGRPRLTRKRKEWVGLTDEEVSEIIGKEIGFNSCFGPEESFARAIEAKLKEKNT